MANYLRKYVGTYRVKAEYDLSTNDYPRTEDGKLDPSFDDLYIDCRNNIKIKHGTGSILSCYVPTKQRGTNILRKIYEDNISENLPKETSQTRTYFEKLTKQLVENDILISAEVLDYEVYFEFSADMIDYIAKLVGAKTSGAKMSPFSPKNLPREPYKIPDKDMKLYKAAIKDFPTRTVNMGGKSKTMVDGILIQSLTREFDKVIIKSQSKGFDVVKDRKKKCLKGKEYIYSMGLWNEYCEFLKENGGGTE